MSRVRLLLAISSLFVFTSCNLGGSGGSAVDNYPFNKSSQYFTSTKNFVIEVHYEAGAEPYVGSANLNRNQLWYVLQDNLTAIFQYRTTPPTLTVPYQLSDMTAMPDQAKATWTTEEVLALAKANKLADSDANTSRMYIYFVNGYYHNGTSAQNNVLGISIGGTPVIVMFKDVIVSSSGTNVVRRFVEQSTLVHEMGHALGFVNNGVPLTSNYQDTAHGKHSNNQNCVMYYLNEGANDLIGFIAGYQAASNFVMWGSEVLSDAQSFSK